jgi:hypothetical protein
MSRPTNISLAVAALIAIPCLSAASTDALAAPRDPVAGGYHGGMYHGGVYRGGAYRGYAYRGGRPGYAYRGGVYRGNPYGLYAYRHNFARER